jgi:hypothetical protein
MEHEGLTDWELDAAGEHDRVPFQGEKESGPL